MVKIRFIFTAAVGWKVPLAYAIRYFNHSWCSHVAVLDDDNTLLEAKIPKVKATPWAEFEKLNYPYVIGEMECQESQKQRMLEFLRSKIGSPYDWRQDVADWLHINWTKDNAYNCSELTAEAMENAFIPLFKSSYTHRVTPIDLYNDNRVFIIGGNAEGLKRSGDVITNS